MESCGSVQIRRPSGIRDKTFTADLPDVLGKHFILTAMNLIIILCHKLNSSTECHKTIYFYMEN